MKVPSYFKGDEFVLWTEQGAPLKGPDAECNGRKRKGYRNAWYLRPFVIPKRFEGQRILVRFDDIARQAAKHKLYVNQRPVPSVSVFAPEVDVTRFAKVGERNELAVLIAQEELPPAWKTGAGIAGSVWLVRRPMAEVIQGALAMPETSPKALGVRARVANPTTAPSDLSVRGFVTELDGKSRVLETPTAQVNLAPGETTDTTISAAFPEAHLWDIDDPHLYLLWVELVKQGKVIDQWRRRFGFRTFGVKGHDTYLNNKKIHLRLSVGPGWFGSYYSNNRNAVRAFIRNQRAKGFNGAQSWGSMLAADVCDEQGYLLSVDGPEYKDIEEEQYRQNIAAWVCRYGNHPSVVIWWADIWRTLYFNNVWPATLGELLDEKRGLDQQLLLTERIYGEVDPTRPINHYGCGAGGTTFVSVLPHMPPGVPLQEHRDWPLKWHKNPDRRPLYLCEFDLVSKYAYHNMDYQVQWQENSGDFIEQAARWLGGETYRQTQRAIPDPWGRDGSLASGDLKAHHFADCFVNATCIVAKAKFRAWRGFDVAVMSPWLASGGWSEVSMHEYQGPEYETGFPDDPASLGVDDVFPDVVPLGTYNWSVNPAWEPWARKAPACLPTKVHEMMAEQHGPILVYIGGSPEFTAQDHTYFAGEKVEKQIVAINDTRHDLPLTIAVWLGNEVIATEAKTLRPGEVHFRPLDFRAPPVSSRADQTLKLEARTSDQVVYEDELALTFFPRQRAPKVSGRIALYDEKGLTAAMLDAAGVDYRRIRSSEELEGCDYLIIGRESWSEKLSGEALGDAIRGGLSVLSFEQTTNSVIGERLRERNERTFFIQGQGHPLLTGLAEGDFRDWRGSSDMIEAYPRITDFPRVHFPHWGNEGVVSTYPIMKGQCGSFRYLVAAGYDLRETALAELFDGKGKLVLCQCDVTSRYGKDPVATRLVQNLLGYLAKAAPSLEKAIYVGGQEGAEFLRAQMVLTKRVFPRPWMGRW